MMASTSLSLVRLGVLYRRLLMLRFCADTSGKSGDTAFVAAGYLAHVKRWRTFQRAWGDILRDAGVQEFHATDFYSGYGEFAGDEWRHEVNGRMIPGGPKHVSFAKRFTGAASIHTSMGFAFGVEMAAFDEELGDVFRRAKTPHAHFSEHCNREV